MKKRKRMQMELAPKPDPPKTSWWTEPLEWHVWAKRAAAEHPRMSGSKQAQLVRPYVLNDD